MEIKRYIEEYRKYSPKEFFDWLSKGRTLEVRFLNDHKGGKFANWSLIKEIANSINCETRFSSIYINEWEQLNNILKYKIQGKYTATRYYNIFISVNPKRKVPIKTKRGLIFNSYYGGIAGVSHIQTFLCDIEHKERTKINATEIQIEECILGAKFLVKALDLQSYYINISGNGVHLWADIEPIELPIPRFSEFDDKLKYNLKEDPIYTYIKSYNCFIESLNRIIQKYNPKLIVDEGAKDLSRIARPPTSINVKQGLTPRYIGTVDKRLSNIKYNNNNFMSVYRNLKTQGKKLIKKVEKSRKHRYNHLNIRESPLYKLLVSKYLPSIVSRNHYLEQSFARLLRDNEIELEEIQDIIQEIEAVQRKTIQVDHEYLDDDGPFNPEMVNSYCVASKIPLVYDILEEIPPITEGFIDEQKYQVLNKISFTAAKEFIITEVKKPSTYIELKSIVRNLIDADHSRSNIFFTLKFLYLNEWNYFGKERIIIKILNKTRKQK